MVRAIRGTEHGAHCVSETDKAVVVLHAAVRCCAIDGSSCVSKVGTIAGGHYRRRAIERGHYIMLPLYTAAAVERCHYRAWAL